MIGVKLMKKMELPEFAYKCILFLLIIDAAIYNTTVNEVFKDSLHSFCLVGTIAFSILCILVRRYSIKELLAHVGILLLAVMSFGSDVCFIAGSSVPLLLL